MKDRHPLIDWWFRDRKTGHIVIGQFPNATLGVWMVATALHQIFGQGARIEVLRWVGAGALLAWGADELVRGANPFRRVLGAAAVGYEVHAIVLALRGG
jgi:hypothetical protein